MKKNRKRVLLFITWLLSGAAFLFAESKSSLPLSGEADAFSMEPLRDPFWPVGYFPDNWKTIGQDVQAENLSPANGWNTSMAQIQVTGTSRMGTQTLAVINGELKGVGELIAVRCNGLIYQWRLKEVLPSGRVRLERLTAQPDTSGF